MSTQVSGTHYCNYIAGEWVDSADKIDITDPATAEVFASIACAGKSEVDQAVRAARACVDSGVMVNSRPAQRAKIIYQIAVELRAMVDQIAPLLVQENGKTLAETEQEISVAASYFEYYAGMADKIEGRSIPLGEDYVDFTYYEPVGISAQIVPWNYPVDVCARSLAPALAAGNAVIVKSPELTPLSMTYLAVACERAGLPKGALSILCGYGADAGAALAGHSDIDQIVFTGSVATGQTILRIAAERAIPCVMELGGKSAAVVFHDADLDALVTSVDWGIFSNAGQVCSAMSRLIVHEDIHDEVVARIKQLAAEQVVGAGADAHSTLTPVASAVQQQKVLQMCDRATEQGARAVTGGSAPDRAGYFVEPTIFTDVTADMDIFQNEVFGPCIAVTQFSTEQQAWQLANGTEFGLVAGVFTNDINIALRGSKALQAGQVFVNEWFAGGIETPFGGLKKSGYGREKGQEALYSYVNTKNVAIKLRG